MGLERDLQKVLAGLLIALLIIVLGAAFWAVWERDRLLLREDNPRLVEAQAAIRRGALYDRHGELLAQTEIVGRRAVRTWYYPETYSALGYYSLRYGSSGIEAQNETALSGADQQASFTDLLLERAPTGADLQLTIDLDLQTALYHAMESHTGAVIAMDVPSGDLLALISQPTFDPNTLDTDWESLRQNTANPFFNRALQGRYQPGGMLQPMLLAAFDAAGYALDETIIGASAPVQLDRLTLNCVTPPTATSFSLVEAYLWGCPAPFANLAAQMPGTSLERIFSSLAQTSQETRTPVPRTIERLVADALGQGQLTVSPLSIAMLSAAILDDGNAPPLRTVQAVRAPNSEIWVTQQNSQPSIPLLTSDGARLLQPLMIQAAMNISAPLPGVTLGGQTALAYTGEATLSWFSGFVTYGDGGAAVAVILENTSDVDAAAHIGHIALLAAYQAHVHDTASAASP